MNRLGEASYFPLRKSYANECPDYEDKNNNNALFDSFVPDFITEKKLSGSQQKRDTEYRKKNFH